MSSVCVASIVRIIVMDKLVKTQDFTWALYQVFIWSCCEPFIGIVCACLPTYAPLARYWWNASGSRRYNLFNGSKKHTSEHTKSSKRSWSRFQKPMNEIPSGEDEIELTSIVDISSSRQNPGHQAVANPVEHEPGSEILVTRDFSWSIRNVSNGHII